MKSRNYRRPPVAALTLLAATGVALGGCGVASVVSATATVAGQTVKTGATVAGAAGRGAVKGTRAAGRFVTKPFRDEKPPEAASLAEPRP